MSYYFETHAENSESFHHMLHLSIEEPVQAEPAANTADMLISHE